MEVNERTEPNDATPPHEPGRPPRPVVVFDGACGFCTGWAQRLARMDTERRLEIVAFQTPGLVQRLPQLAEVRLGAGVRLIRPDGWVFVGADAVHEIARYLPGWRRLAWLYHIPGLHQAARYAYARFAAQRYTWGDGTAACAVPASQPAKPTAPDTAPPAHT